MIAAKIVHRMMMPSVETSFIRSRLLDWDGTDETSEDFLINRKENVAGNTKENMQIIYDIASIVKNDSKVSHEDKIRYNTYLNIADVSSKIVNHLAEKKTLWGWGSQDAPYWNRIDAGKAWDRISDEIIDHFQSKGFKVTRTDDNKTSLIIEW